MRAPYGRNWRFLMQRINAVALGAALLIGIAGVAGAQGTQPPATGRVQGQRGPGGEGRRGFGRGREFGGRLAKDLNLTDAIARSSRRFATSTSRSSTISVRCGRRAIPQAREQPSARLAARFSPSRSRFAIRRTRTFATFSPPNSARSSTQLRRRERSGWTSIRMVAVSVAVTTAIEAPHLRRDK